MPHSDPQFGMTEGEGPARRGFFFVSGGHRGDNQAFTGRTHSFMNCPSCGGRATVSNGRCTACGVALHSAKSDGVWTRALDAAAAKAAGLGSGAIRGKRRTA